MPDYTPGPWKVPKTDPLIVVTEDDLLIADTMGVDEIDVPTAKANARLIAAAPDLLAACESIVNMLGSDCHVYKTGELARAAIAKARGTEEPANA